MVFTGVVLVMGVSLTEDSTTLIGVSMVLMIFIGIITGVLAGALVSTLLSETLDMVTTIIFHITDIITMDTEIILITDLIQWMV